MTSESEPHVSEAGQITLPTHESGNLTSTVSTILFSIFGSIRKGVQRLAFGNPPREESSTQFTYDPVDKRWKPADGGSNTEPPSPRAGDMLYPSSPPKHTPHLHCISPGGLPGSIPSHPSRPRLSCTSRVSELSLADLAHPVYAPAGSITNLSDPFDAPKPTKIEPIIRTSPFAS
jgi:hypothetical protein